MSNQASANLSTRPFILGDNFSASHKLSTILQDAGRSTVLAPFTVMGKKKYTVPTSGTAGTNTGNGTCTVVSANGQRSLKIGSYVLECTFAVTNGGVFKLTDPDGIIIADNLTLRVGAGLLTAFAVGGLDFTITDGSTDFAAGDKFTIAVASVAKFYPLKPSDVLGLEAVAGIYVGDEIAAATIAAGDVTNCDILLAGYVVDKNLLVFENSATLATLLPSGKTVEEELRDLGFACAASHDITGYENA